MKRLIDDPELPGAGARLAELVRQTEPFKPNPFRKRSVFSRLHAPSRSAFRLRGPALTVALLFVGTATAGAAVGYEWVGSSSEQEPPVDSAATSGANATPRTRTMPVTRATANPQKPRESKPEPEAAEPAPVDPPARRTEERSSPARTTVGRSSTAAGNALPPGEDPAPVLDAIRALRKSGDPARAQKLLDEYLESNPRGALSEDALGLAIEAAAARRDPRAADYARRYLARFPNGRFRAVAIRASQKR